MATVKEFREFFLRASQVNSGAKADQETGFPVSYLVTIAGVATLKFNRFLKNHFPSENVNKKLLESITFKLNPEDTAGVSIQGLSKIATDAEVKANTTFATYGDSFRRSVQPSQVPTIIEAINVATLTSPFTGIATDSFPTDVVDVEVDGTVATRNNYKVKTSSNLNAFFSNLLTIVYAYINSWTISFGADHATAIGVITTAATAGVGKQITLVNETWKLTGGATAMANTQPAPSFETGWGAAVLGDTLQLRKTYDGKLAIRGAIVASAGHAANMTLLTLPTGYTIPTGAGKPLPLLWAWHPASETMIALGIVNGNQLKTKSTTFAILNGEELRIQETIISLT